VKNVYLTILFIISLLLSACGGDSKSEQEVELLDVSQAESQLAFYLPSWFDHSGKIMIRSADGDIITSLETSSLNTEHITLNANQAVVIEYIPITRNIACPVTSGCGNSFDYDHEDINDNGIIDHEEVFSVNSTFAAKVFLSPGSNKVYFSLLSLIESSTKVNSHLKSLSVTPNYHQTYVDEDHSQRYQFLANGSYHSLFRSLESINAIAQIEESLTSFVKDNEISTITTNYFSKIDQYLSEQQAMNDDAFINHDLIEEKIKLNRLLVHSNEKFTESHSNDLKDKVLLEQFRNIFAFINIQELKYNDEVSNKIKELSNIVTDDSENTTAIFSEVLTDVLQLYSPTNDTPAGLYQYNGLDINYSGSPYTWIISGRYKETEINLELVIPQWRISAARGDFFQATILGNVSSADTTLAIDTDELLLKFDGVEDVFNEDKAETAIFKLITNISVATQDGEITGRINIDGERVKDDNGQLFTILKQFSFSGLLTTINQTTNISIIAAKYSKSLEQNENDFFYNILLDLPSSGSADFRLSISGLNTNFERLDKVNLALKMQEKILELNLEQANNVRKLMIKGLDGRWLTLDQKNKNYSGYLYFGNLVIGEIITIRGLPGVLFPNGDFHSIF
jgi:hypothetical protein